jgi:hypothetical protein
LCPFKIISNLVALRSYNHRLHSTAEHIHRVTQLGIDSLKVAARQFQTRLLLGEKYEPSKQIPCATTLFRVQTVSEYQVALGDDYGLSTVSYHNACTDSIFLSLPEKICQGTLQILLIPGNHRTFLQDDNVKMLAQQIMTVALPTHNI